MAGGGGAEAHARNNQYQLRSNSSLVLLASSDPRSRDGHVPSGEAESLRGRIDPKSFGDRVRRGRPKRHRRDPSPPEPFASSKRRRIWEESVLTATEEDGVVYRPKTKETRAAYEAMLHVIRQLLGDQPASVVHGAADEVLAVIKGKRFDKRKEIENLLNSVGDNVFDQIVQIGKLITDYGDDDDDDDDIVGCGDGDFDVGVAVDFEEDEEEEEEGVGTVVEDEDEDEEEQRESVAGGAIVDGDDVMVECSEGVSVNVHEIDAYWVQRKIYEAYEKQIEPQQCRELAEEVVSILGEGGVRDVESRLLEKLRFDKFGLIKFLLLNRVKIVWCTRLARAGGQEERKRIEEEMLRSGPDSAAIVEELCLMRASVKERQKSKEMSIKAEARKLKKAGVVDRDGESGDWWKNQDQQLDLDSIAQEQSRRFLVPNKFELPKGSYRHSSKGYEEIHVPALKPRPFNSDEKLVLVSAMPEWTQLAFKGMTQLNRVQSQVYRTALEAADNILLCAPTGSGKTNVAVLTILQQLGLHMNQEDGSIDHSKYKIVYIAPMKALVAEVVGNLSNRLQDYGVTWDIITRKSGDYTSTKRVKLLIIDEIHLLHDSRGPVLESIVARTVRQIETTKEHVRLVGLSATLPNYEDVASFLRVDKKGLFYFDNSFRPIPLSQQYIGITARKSWQKYQLMKQLCYEKVMAVAGKHQVLIFVHSRKETAKTAGDIRDSALANDSLGRFLKEDSGSCEIIRSELVKIKSNDLKSLLPYGFAIHHAGMDRADRQLVEDLFAKGHVQVLVSTATLAWGVNLPAHTVIIKGTEIYDPEKGAWTELSPLDVMQMLGRAGRPQYDSCGEGIIITGHKELHHYLSLMNQQLPIESQFLSKLADQLNAEIVLGNVQNAREASHWLTYSYMYVRMLKSPILYGLEADVLAKDSKLEERRADLIHSAATILEKNNMIVYDRRSGYFQVTDLGRIASYYYITHGTVSTYNEHLKPTMGDSELCRLFSLSEEFKYVTVRQDEKIELAKLLDRVPIVVKESLDEPSAKINVLLQAYISQLKLEGFSLASDMSFITQSAGRLLRALFEIALKRGWAEVAEKALNLCKMVSRRMWTVQTLFRQFNGLITNDILMKLEKKDLAWERYYDLSSQELGELIRFPTLGRTLHKLVHQFPKLNLAAHLQPITHTVLKFELTITPDFQWEDKVHGYVEPFWVIVENNDREHILHHEYFLLKKQYMDEDHTLIFTVPIYEPLPPQYFIRVVSDRWLRSETVLPVLFRDLILPAKCPPPTELLDLQPLPVTALRNPLYEALYDQDLMHFNSVQTQVFTALYNSDDNVLVAAPTGNGKTICAEFAILRNHQKSTEPEGCVMRVVYIASFDAIAEVTYVDWKKKFGDGLKLNVVKLTGELAMDLKLLEQGQVIISTPEKWDYLSRCWKRRENVQQVSLFIVDELHLISGEGGQIIETIVSRMRLIASRPKTKIRIVALSTSVANAKDLGEWIGDACIFNFSPGVRQVPLDIDIQGVDLANFYARMEAMVKATWTAIVQHAKNGKQALVYVPTMKHVRLTAKNLVTYSNSDIVEKLSFLLQFSEDIGKVSDEKLRSTLSCGVGYLHEGLPSEDQEAVTKLFKDRSIQVCVVSSSMCWGVPLSAHLVVVMGTQYYDGTDYPVTDLLQMMGHANLPQPNDSGKCVILCHAPRKEYYRKFLYEAFPVESQLHHYLHDILNAEVVSGIIETMQDAVDYLSWTFLFRRLTQNPNYYELQGVTYRHLSDHLSRLVETTVYDLKRSGCVSIEDDMDLYPLNLGVIATYYHAKYTTIERFSSSLTSKTTVKGLLQILAQASEFSELPIRPGEEEVIQRLANHQRFSFENPKYTDSHDKALALLQAHFSRQPVGAELALDQQEVLTNASRLIHAMVDVCCTNGWLRVALLVMEVSQMLTQGLWKGDSEFLQLPHFTKELAKRCQENPGKSVQTISDLKEMKDDERHQLLQLPETELMAIEHFCEQFPDIVIDYEVLESENVRAGEEFTLEVNLEFRHKVRTAQLGCDDVKRYRKDKEDGCWVVVSDNKLDSVVFIKRVPHVKKLTKLPVTIAAPAEAGTTAHYKLFLMCDSYMGCDQESDLIPVEIK
ncbi:DExH-box ATP-dependent RNA helicase DExH12 [Rosa chinensis]|uniref:DExH-box ATP-dependent RNA helicase DExH12 n=1 Tax=Rosa chinensis TaxID=74649 RepID=UPI000D08F24D|nr:DExH-box ATP-dependent RNA helicase DExH12 [Rosa chinensis]